VVGFSVQVFDPRAPRYVWSGADAGPGVAGVDDDGNGAADDANELGWPGTDDEVVSVNDPRIDEVLVGNGNRSLAQWNQSPAMPFFRVNSGDFVDLGYMRLAGGPMRGLFQFDESGGGMTPGLANDTPTVAAPRALEFMSPFSGYSADPNVYSGATASNLTDRFSLFPTSWENSGRMIVRSSGGSPFVSSF